MSGSSVFNIQYTRDDAGRITQKTETVNGQTSATAYSYDTAGHLSDVVVNGTSTAHYDYDENGNRTHRTTPSATETGTYDAQDRLTSYNGATFTYTADGELQTKTDASGTTTYTYDVLGNLRRVVLPNGNVIDYVIDGLNRRVGKKINGAMVKEWLYVDQLRPVAELDGTGAVISTFVYATRSSVPDFMVRGGTTYRIISDHLGSPRFILDAATNTLAETLIYDEFGNVLSDSNPGFQPFGFAGGLHDGDAGLVRFGARDYDPHTGRWTVKDPIGFDGGDLDLYNYALADPLNMIDVDGLESGKLPGTNATYRIDWNQEPHPNMHVYWPNGDESVISHEGGWLKTHGGKPVACPPRRYRGPLRKVVNKFTQKAAKMDRALMLLNMVHGLFSDFDLWLRAIENNRSFGDEMREELKRGPFYIETGLGTLKNPYIDPRSAI